MPAKLTWTAASKTGTTVSSYQPREAGVVLATLGAGVLTYTDDSATTGTAYDVVATFADGTSVTSAAVTYSAGALTPRQEALGVSVPAVTNFLGGTVTQTQRHARLDRLKETGAGWVRFDLPAYIIEVTQGVRDWTNVTATVSYAKSIGLKVLLCPSTLPSWALTDVGLAAGTEWKQGPTTATQRTAFRDFCVAAVNQFPTVDAWEMWNEPNITGFWSPTPSTTDYKALIDVVYPAMKAVTTKPVIAGGTGQTSGTAPNITAVNWYSALHTAGANTSWDAVTLHPYQNLGDARTGSLFTGDWAAIDPVRTQMVNAGDSAKQMWATEFGWPAQATGDATHPSYAEQASWLRPSLDDWYARTYAGPTFHYSLFDRTSDGELRGFGFYQEDETTAKPNRVSSLAWIAGSAPASLADSWTDSNGATWNPQRWRWETTNTAVIDVQANEGRMFVPLAQGGRTRAIAYVLPAQDWELLTAVRYDDSTAAALCHVRFWLRASGGWAAAYRPNNGYGVELRSSSATVTPYKSVAGVETALTTGTGPVVGTTKRWLRLRMQGSTLSARVWLDGSSEPGTWTVENTALTEVTTPGVLYVTNRAASASTVDNTARLDDLTLTAL